MKQSNRSLAFFAKNVFLGLSFFFLCAFGSEHSKVEAVTSFDKASNTIELKFVVSANDGLMITPEGPWGIQINNATDLAFEKGENSYRSKTFDPKIPGFLVKAKVSEKSKTGKLDYKIKAFVCTKDKTRCYPQTIKGKLDWKI